MSCGGNTGIMCGTCDMGRKSFGVGPTVFRTPPPQGGVTPEKNIPPGIKNIFLPPPARSHQVPVLRQGCACTKGRGGKEIQKDMKRGEKEMTRYEQM